MSLDITRPRQAEIFARVMQELAKPDPSRQEDWALKEAVVLAIIELGSVDSRNDDELVKAVLYRCKQFI